MNSEYFPFRLPMCFPTARERFGRRMLVTGAMMLVCMSGPGVRAQTLEERAEQAVDAPLSVPDAPIPATSDEIGLATEALE